MRLALGLFVLCLAAAPASAQSPFLTACTTSAEGEGGLPAPVAERICGCTEAAALAAGETAASLDRYQAFAATLTPGATGMAETESPPEWAVVTSSILMTSMGGCLAEVREEMTSAEGEEAAVPTSVAAPASGTTQATTPAPPSLPTGLRTGDGGGQVRSVQQGNGAAVRILE